jgi:hypothetical protein
MGNDPEFVTMANNTSRGIHTNAIRGISPMAIDKWKGLLLAEHSTLEFSDFFVKMFIDGRAINHLVRHTKGHPRHVVQSQREDWTKQERPSSETPRHYDSKWTPYSWIQMARQRLCFKAALYTREVIVDAKKLMRQEENYFFKGISWASVPECVYRNGCPYSNSCGWYEVNKDIFHGCGIRGRYNEYERIICSNPS